MTSKDNGILDKTLWGHRKEATVEKCMKSQTAKNNQLDIGDQGQI